METFQIPLEVAEAYEARFVPALFAGWAADLLDAVRPAPGQRVLDVACGTGVVARGAAARVGATGRVTGLDLNEAMLTVARRTAPDLDWRQGDVADLPFPGDTFDLVLCQAALMFFPDPARALREMARVTRTGGTVAVHVPGRLSASDAYVRLTRIAARHAGPSAVELLSTYFALGDPQALRALLESAGLRVSAFTTRMSTLVLGSAEEFVAVEVESTPLIDRISPEVYRRIKDEAVDALQPYGTPDGIAVPIEGHIVIATPHR